MHITTATKSTEIKHVFLLILFIVFELEVRVKQILIFHIRWTFKYSDLELLYAAHFYYFLLISLAILPRRRWWHCLKRCEKHYMQLKCVSLKSHPTGRCEISPSNRKIHFADRLGGNIKLKRKKLFQNNVYLL